MSILNGINVMSLFLFFFNSLLKWPTWVITGFHVGPHKDYLQSNCNTHLY